MVERMIAQTALPWITPPGVIAAGRSEFRRMAEISGAFVGHPPLTPLQRLPGDIAAAGKSACFSADAGGSLLSPLVMAYQAAKDKCN